MCETRDEAAPAANPKSSPLPVRPLRRGDNGTVERIFEQLGERSRRFRLGAAKRELTSADRELLTRVDNRHHVLVAYAGETPVAMAHLVRDNGDPSSAEVGLAVADEWQGRNVGARLARRLAAEASRLGITRVHASIDAENPLALSIMRAETTIVATRIEGGVLNLVGLLNRPPAGSVRPVAPLPQLSRTPRCDQ